MSIEFTAKGSGYFRVVVDGAEVSRHTTEREALEAAQKQEAGDPSRDVKITHEYAVAVEETAPPINVDGEALFTIACSDPSLVRIEGGPIKVVVLGDGNASLTLARVA